VYHLKTFVTISKLRLSKIENETCEIVTLSKLLTVIHLTLHVKKRFYFFGSPSGNFSGEKQSLIASVRILK